jgi:predicted flap endonuclease-1-like 5' DNA nuclease
MGYQKFNKDMTMFNNDVTKTYEMMDATFEILIMLAGAFLLGALFSWALGKLRGNKPNRKQLQQRKTVDQQNGFRQPTQQAGANYPDNFDTGNIVKKTGAAAIIGGSVAAVGSGIASAGSSATETARGTGSKLAKAGSAVTESLSDTGSSIKESASDAFSSDALSSVGDKISDTGSAIKETSSDALSSAGDTLSDAGSSIQSAATDTLDNANDKVSNAESALSETVNKATVELDDFKIIEGIGSKIETALHTAGVKTYADLRASDSETIKVILNTASPAFHMHDPETWSYQADLAYNGKWDKLKEYQDFLMGREE